MAFRPLLSSFSPKKTLFFGEPKSTPLIFPTVHCTVIMLTETGTYLMSAKMRVMELRGLEGLWV